MAYRLKYSDYPGTAEGPPDPERWVGPPGPMGPPGLVGPQGPQGQPQTGGPFLPLSGGTVTGPVTINGPITGTGIGFDIGDMPGPLANFQGSGIPALQTTGRLVISKVPGTEAATDFATLEIHRTSRFSGGAGQSNAAFRVIGDYGASDSSAEWTTIFTGTTAATGGQTVGGSFNQGTRTAGTSSVWAAIADVRDTTGLSSATMGGGPTIGFELDIEANKADDATNTGSLGGTGNRKALAIVGFRYTTADTAQTQFSHGIWFSTSTTGSITPGDAHTNFGSAIGFATNTQVYSALDTRLAVAPTGSGNPVAAVSMSAGHVVDFHGGTTLASAPGNYLQYMTTGAARLRYMVGTNEWLSVGDTGTVTINTSAGSWGSINVGKQLMLTSPATNNPGLAITDPFGANIIGIYNSSGTLVVAGMPAYSDSTTAPNQFLILAAAGVTVGKPLVFGVFPTPAANDAAAASAGVALGGVYRIGNALQVRLA